MYKKQSNLLCLTALLTSSTMVGGFAQAETLTSNVTANSNELSLIRAIGDDPMVKPTDMISPVTNRSTESELIQQINQYKVASPTAKTAQNVTSVSQLSDVKPTDWAFTALQSLVERYGCIAGYPDSTYRGRQATTRYEFAAGLNACMDKINEIISAGLSDKVGKEDLATLQKLQEEFAAELATLQSHLLSQSDFYTPMALLAK